MTGPRALDVSQAVALLAERTVIDVRDAVSFADGHLAGSGHLCLSDFESRRSELPSRKIALLVVGASASEAAAAAHDLVARGFESVCFLNGPIHAMQVALDDRSPPARLWRPSPLLETVLPVLPPGQAADLACGGGRDAVFLAMNGFTVEAWDHDREALRRAEALATRHGVTITTVESDLERPEFELPERHYSLIVCVRFLHRPLFPTIERTLAPGGHLVYETFRVGQERYGKPRRKQFLLESEELLSAFPTLEVLRYVESDPPGGPVLAGLVAKRPAK